MKKRTVFSMVLTGMLAMSGCSAVGPKANCALTVDSATSKVAIDPMTKMATMKSPDCLGAEICTKVVYDATLGDTAMICASPNALCSAIEADCAAKGKVCSLVMGIPTCDFVKPAPGPCEGYTCPSNAHCEVNAANMPLCNSNNGLPDGTMCTADMQCQSTKCVAGKCVAKCTADVTVTNDGAITQVGCNTNEWCDLDGTKICKPDLADGQTVCSRNAQCMSGKCDTATGACTAQPTGMCSQDVGTNGCTDSKWCDLDGTKTCKDDFAVGVDCKRDQQCFTGFCAASGTCQNMPLPGACNSHKLTIPAAFTKDFGAATGPAQGTDLTRQMLLTISGNKATSTGQMIQPPGGSWVTTRKVGDTIEFCPDGENLLLNGSAGGNYVVGGRRNNGVCEADIEPTLYAAVMANITTTTGIEVAASVLCNTTCGCNLYVRKKK